MRATLSQSAAEMIKKEIIEGKFAVGDRLPNEQELMDRLDVSRTTVREAVKILVSQNVLKIVKGKGTYVSNNVGQMEDPFGLDFVPREILTTDFQVFRDINEPYVCYLAALHATPEELEETEKALERMGQELSESSGNDREQVVDRIARHELEFHSLLYKMTHNVLYERIMPMALKGVMYDYAAKLYDRGFLPDKNLIFHRTLYELIRDGEAETAFSRCREQCVVVWEKQTVVALLGPAEEGSRGFRQ